MNIFIAIYLVSEKEKKRKENPSPNVSKNKLKKLKRKKKHSPPSCWYNTRKMGPKFNLI